MPIFYIINLQFKNLGSLHDIISGISSIDAGLSFKEQASGIRKYIDTLDNIADVSTVFKKANVSKELASAALEGSKFVNETGDIIGGMADSAEAVNDFKKSLDGLDSGEKGVSGLKAVFTGLADTIGISTTALGVLTAGLAVAVAGFYAYKAYQQSIRFKW